MRGSTTYRSKGVHTNRKGGKTSRVAVDRNGKKWGKPTKEKAQVAAAAVADQAAAMQASQDRFSAEHDAMVQSGGDMMAQARQSVPGKAQDIINRRRV